MVCEGDTVVYRTGSWYVDGVLVGEEDAVAEYKLCRVDTIQVVWTHNCEHGVLRGLAVDIKNDADGEEEKSPVPATSKTKQKTTLSLRTPLEDIEFGPEQLIARINNVVWQRNDDQDIDYDEEKGTCSIPLHESMWEENDDDIDE